MGKFSKLLGKCMVVPIIFYRYFISPVLGKHCRFEPTCSAYAQSAIERFGVIQGLYLTLKRIFSCHPWCEGGYDPVPEKLIESKQ